MPIPPIPPSLPGLPKVNGATTGNLPTFTNNGGAVVDSGFSFNDNTQTNQNLWSAAKIATYVTDSLLNVPTLPAVLLATTANLSLTGAATVDGVAVATGNIVLVKNQTTASQNGVYRAVTTGPWVQQMYNTTTEAWQDVVGVTTMAGLNINGGVALVTSGNTQRNTQYQCSIPTPTAPFPGGSAVNWTANSRIPLASITNRFVDVSIGNDTNNNGSQSFPFATVTRALVGASYPLCITLSSSIPETSVISWTSGQQNSIVQGMTSDLTGGMNSMTGAQTFLTGGTRNDFKQIVFNTGATAPLTYNAGYLFRNNIENCSVNTTAPSWIVFPTNAQNWLSINNVQVAATTAINLPAFTNQFTIYVANQIYGPIVFTGTGAANTVVTITNCNEYFVQLPPTYLGSIVWQDISLNVRLGSTIIPNGVITSQAQLTTVLSHTADTTYDGNYVITGFTPIANNYGNGDVFTKTTVSGFTRSFWLRKYAYCPATIASIDGRVYQQANTGLERWILAGTSPVIGHQYEGVYYVDPLNGLDTNPGTYDEPWLTLEFANATVPSNSIVYLAPGTYNVPTVLTPANTNITWEGMDRKSTILQVNVALPSGKTLNIQNLTANFGSDFFAARGVLNATDCDFAATLRTNNNGAINLLRCTANGYSVVSDATFNAANCSMPTTTFGGNGSGVLRFFDCSSLGRISGTNTSVVASNCSITAQTGTTAISMGNSSGISSVDLTNVKLFAAGSGVPGSGSINFGISGGSLFYVLNDVVYATGSSNFSSAVRATRPVSFDALTLGQPLPVSSGGTNTTALAANGAMVMNSIGNQMLSLVPGASGNILTSNGTNWVSAPLPSNIIRRVSGVIPLNFIGNNAFSFAIPTQAAVMVHINVTGPNASAVYIATIATNNPNLPLTGQQCAMSFTGDGAIWRKIPDNFAASINGILYRGVASVADTNVLRFELQINTPLTVNWSYVVLSQF